MQQFQQSSTTNKVVIIGLVVVIAGALVCACAATGWLLLAPSRSDDAPPVAVASPIPSQPTAEPTPVECSGWQGEYFNNTNLLSDPALVRPVDPVTLLADPGRAAVRLGWRATTPFEVMIRRMVEADIARVSAA